MINDTNESYEKFLKKLSKIYNIVFPKMNIQMKTKNLLSFWITKGLTKFLIRKQKTKQNKTKKKIFENVSKKMKF